MSSVCTCFSDVAYWKFAHVFQHRPRDKSQRQFPNKGQRQHHAFPGHSPILSHEQLKLAGAVPGDHGPSKKIILFLPVQFAASKSNLWSRTLPASARNRRLQTVLLHRQNHRGYRELFSQRSRWVGPTLPTAQKVQASSVSQKSHYPLLFLTHFISPHN